MSKVIIESEKRITCGFEGYPGHKGVDLGWRKDESQNKIYTNCKGIVVDVQDGLDKIPGATGVKSWGNYILVKHPNGMHSRYAHMKKGLLVKVGQLVDENVKLGIIGDSGNVTARHLHFEVSTGYSSSTRINPTEYLTRAIYVEPVKPIEPIKPVEPTPKPSPEVKDFKIGDKVVVSGFATSQSDGNGSKTATYGGNVNDASDIRYITLITNLNTKRPYHISKGKTFGDGDRGWVSKDQIKKI